MKLSPWFKALVASLVLSFLVAFGLYYFSEQFFAAKNKQTLITSSDLGKDLNSDVILPVGETAPDFELKQIMLDKPAQNKTHRLLSDKSTYKVVNFWASWCEPCVEEFTSFARLVKAYQGKVSFYAVGQDKTLEESRDFIEAFSTDFSALNGVYFLFDKDKLVSKKYGVLALPETYILDPSGKLLKRVTGFFDWDQKQVRVFFDRLLNKDSGGGFNEAE